MKKFFIVLLAFSCYGAVAQSPALIVNFNIDTIKANVNFKIQMKFCEPLKKSSSKSYFTNDTSTINFKKLTEKDIICDRYIQNYNNSDYHYYFSNQVFAWEKIIVWKISSGSGDTEKPMYVMLPVKIKSFVTFIEINHVLFQPGKFIWIDEYGQTGSNSGRNFTFSLKNKKGTDLSECSLKPLLN